MHDITLLLQRMHDGEAGAADQLMDRVYADLRRIAAAHLRRRFGAAADGITLQPTALVNETYLALIRQRKRFDSQGQFFALATRLMIRVLIDYQRERLARKRGGGLVRVSLDGLEPVDPVPPPVEAVDVAAALEKLDALDPRTGEIVKLKLLWGLTVPEIAATLELSDATVERDWSYGRRWLAAHLAPRRR